MLCLKRGFAAGALATCWAASLHAEAPISSARVFMPQQAEEARRLAQRECKPLVVHVLPNNRLGYAQLTAFYGSGSGVDPAVLEKVIVAVIPRERYSGFAKELGIASSGGLRTISPYSLNTLDARSKSTCSSGFR